MWFLYFWLISIIVCVFIFWMIVLNECNKAKRKFNLKTTNKHKLIFSETFVAVLQTTLVLSIPFLNIIMVIYFLFAPKKVTKTNNDGIEIKLK